MAAYLDYNASTPLDPRALEAMTPFLTANFANASSIHRAGRAARAAVELAREQVAALVGAHASQVIFTGGGTEANNTVLKGAAYTGGGLAVSAVEHASVLDPALALARRGVRVVRIGVDAQGRVGSDQLQAALRPGTDLVSVMYANNETGIVHDIPRLADIARRAGALFHTDAIQAAGKIPVDFAASDAHFMTLAAHKIYGPKGVGAIVLAKDAPLEPLVHGGGQEKGRRGGTENVAGIVGFGAAAELAMAEMAAIGKTLRALRERLETSLHTRVPEAVIFGAGAERLPNTVLLAVPGIEGETLLLNMDKHGFALSSGAACAAGAREPSHVLRAMGVPHDLARGALRVSLGHGNTERDVDAFIEALVAECASLRAGAWA